ncbi:unnamed protein product [Rotaria sp. Silwood1]|nr:unnamed protein product [Rotaria sp. Silwood1]CAF1613443.1 unnamed protein product [Rotaria sp. Silwood1]
MLRRQIGLDAAVNPDKHVQSQSASSSSSSINSSKPSKLSTINGFRMLCRSSSADAETAPKQKQKAKPFTLKQEFSLYISTSTSISSKYFQTYWDANKTRLPTLASYAPRYN